MSSRPWLKFYPTAWRSDPKLRLCSLAARGLWIEALCLMHETEPRGYLVVSGRPVTVAQLASLTGAREPEVKRLLAELVEAGVCDLERGAVVSRRMVRDTEKEARDKANGKEGGNPHLKPWVNPHDKPRDKAKILEAREEPIQEEAIPGWDDEADTASTPALRVVR